MKLISILAGMLISKIDTFGAQKTRTHTLKCRRTQKRVTILCEFWSRGIIGLFFFDNEHIVAVTVNGDRYRAMLSEFLFIKI